MKNEKIEIMLEIENQTKEKELISVTPEKLGEFLQYLVANLWARESFLGMMSAREVHTLFVRIGTEELYLTLCEFAKGLGKDDKSSNEQPEVTLSHNDYAEITNKLQLLPSEHLWDLIAKSREILRLREEIID